MVASGRQLDFDLESGTLKYRLTYSLFRIAIGFGTMPMGLIPVPRPITVGQGFFLIHPLQASNWKVGL